MVKAIHVLQEIGTHLKEKFKNCRDEFMFNEHAQIAEVRVTTAYQYILGLHIFVKLGYGKSCEVASCVLHVFLIPMPMQPGNEGIHVAVTTK